MATSFTSPDSYYRQQSETQQQQLNKIRSRASVLSWLRLGAGVLIIVLIYLLLQQNSMMLWTILGLNVIGFFYLMTVHGAAKEKEARLAIHIHLLEAEIKAVNGDNSSFHEGKGYIDASHPYSFDLDIFGKGSVYQMLCRSATKDGERGLAELLKQPYTNTDEVRERQACIRELSAMPGFLEQFRIAGIRYEEGPNDRKKLLSWLHDQDRFLNKKYLFAFAALIPICTLFFGTLSVMQSTIHQGLAYVLLTSWTILMIHSKNVKETHLLVGRSVKLIDKYEQLLQIIATPSFNTHSLKDIQVKAAVSVKLIAELRKLAHLFDSRQNGMVGPFMNSFFLFDIYCVLRLELWRRKNLNLLDESFEHIAIVDTYVSLATYAFNNPEQIYPVVKTGDNSIEATGLKHPLLNKKNAVGNDVSLGNEEQLFLLTGANMTGKSTFIRTVGINVILAYTGLPIAASAFSLPVLRLYSAMRISDSVQDDISYFKAELNRMQKLMQTVKESITPYLVLLDEPLRGTNSTDKQLGTQSVIEKLVSYSVIGIVATHDTGLCKLETAHQGKISNYHFESEVKENGLLFDFKLKRGGSTSNNATILMKIMGIID